MSVAVTVELAAEIKALLLVRPMVIHFFLSNLDQVELIQMVTGAQPPVVGG